MVTRLHLPSLIIVECSYCRTLCRPSVINEWEVSLDCKDVNDNDSKDNESSSRDQQLTWEEAEAQLSTSVSVKESIYISIPPYLDPPPFQAWLHTILTKPTIKFHINKIVINGRGSL